MEMIRVPPTAMGLYVKQANNQTKHKHPEKKIHFQSHTQLWSTVFLQQNYDLFLFEIKKSSSS